MSRQRTTRDTDINAFTGTEMNPYIVDVPTRAFGWLRKGGVISKEKEAIQRAKEAKDVKDAAQRALAGSNKEVKVSDDETARAAENHRITGEALDRLSADNKKKKRNNELLEQVLGHTKQIKGGKVENDDQDEE